MKVLYFLLTILIAFKGNTFLWYNKVFCVPFLEKNAFLCYKTYFYTKILDYFKKKHYFCT